jgi:hypothetical protein
MGRWLLPAPKAFRGQGVQPSRVSLLRSLEKKKKTLLALNRSSSTTSRDEAHSVASLTSLPISLLASSASCHHDQGPAGRSSSCGLRSEAEQSGCNSGMSSRLGCAQRRGTGDRPHVNRKKSHGGALDLKWGSARRMWRPW